MPSPQSKVCMVVLAGGQIRGTTTHAAGGISKSAESSVALLDRVLKPVND